MFIHVSGDGAMTVDCCCQQQTNIVLQHENRGTIADSGFEPAVSDWLKTVGRPPEVSSLSCVADVILDVRKTCYCLGLMSRHSRQFFNSYGHGTSLKLDHSFIRLGRLI